MDPWLGRADEQNPQGRQDRSFHYDKLEELATYLKDYLWAYNSARATFSESQNTDRIYPRKMAG